MQVVNCLAFDHWHMEDVVLLSEAGMFTPAADLQCLPKCLLSLVATIEKVERSH